MMVITKNSKLPCHPLKPQNRARLCHARLQIGTSSSDCRSEPTANNVMHLRHLLLKSEDVDDDSDGTAIN